MKGLEGEYVGGSDGVGGKEGEKGSERGKGWEGNKQRNGRRKVWRERWKEEGLEEEDVQTVLPVPVLLQWSLTTLNSLGPELVQISENFRVVGKKTTTH